MGRLLGKVCRYAGGQNSTKRMRAGLVYVTNHEYWGTYGVSNWVQFQYIGKDGYVLKGKRFSGADYDNGPFTVVKGARITTVVKLPKDAHP